MATNDPPAALFPPGCKCQSYGRGLTMTRVDSPYCPIHANLAYQCLSSPLKLVEPNV